MKNENEKTKELEARNHEWKSNEILSLNHFINDEHCIITYWYDSTDVIIPADSPYSHKGTARHMLLPPAWNTVTEHCPRCSDDWGRAKDGLRPCLSSWCHTSKQTGRNKPLPRMTEEEIIFGEFEDDMHEYIANDINFQSIDYHDAFKPLDEFVQTEEGAKLYKKALDDVNSRADEKVHNPSTTGDNMSDPREGEEDEPPMDDYEDEPPMDDYEAITSQSTGQNNKEE